MVLLGHRPLPHHRRAGARWREVVRIWSSARRTIGTAAACSPNLARCDCADPPTRLGLAEDVPASLLVILWQLGRPEQARRWYAPNQTAVAAFGTDSHYTRSSNASVGLQTYDTVRWLTAQPDLAAYYRCVYLYAVAPSLFYERLRTARAEVCA